MISIGNTLSELEKIHQERQLAVDAYAAAIRNIAHYLLELDAQITGPQRQHLTSLAGEVAGGGQQALVESQATLRGLLREYRDKGSEYLNQLREELASTARSLQEVLDTVSQTDGDHESRLRTALTRIREVSQAPEAAPVRAQLLAAEGTIEQSLDQIRKQHQLAVAQFQVEIRMLHKRIDALEAASSIDQLTKLLCRDEMEERIRSAKAGYSLLLARVNGFRLAELHYNQEVAAELTGAFAKRFRNSLPPAATVARWSTEEFVAMVSVPKSEAITLAKWISEHLSGLYACLHAGKTVRPALQLTVAVVDSAGNSPSYILQRVTEFLPGL